MATARKVQLTTADTGVFSIEKATQESAETASRILQENHEVRQTSLPDVPLNAMPASKFEHS